jgi:hypothetical protein
VSLNCQLEAAKRATRATAIRPSHHPHINAIPMSDMESQSSATQATPSQGLPKSRTHHRHHEAGPADPVPVDKAESDVLVASAPEQGNPSVLVPSEIYGEPPKADLSGIDTLIIVCCHAIYDPAPSSPLFPLQSPQYEENWHLSSFQRSDASKHKPGEHETFLLHINRGLELLELSPNAILVFSGGRTKQQLTPLSEAESYYNASLSQAISQGSDQSRRLESLRASNRILLEEYATDSLQNLLYSMHLFRQYTTRHPQHVRVITHAFKMHRFLNLHAPAVGYAKEQIQVEGINPPFSGQELASVMESEAATCAEFEKDPLGDGDRLRAKRRARGWVERSEDAEIFSWIRKGMKDKKEEDAQTPAG